MRHENIKLLNETMDKTFSDTNHTNVFLGQSPKTIEIKETINKTNWEKTFANDATDGGLISEIRKQLIQLNNKNETTRWKNGQKT